MQEKLGSTRRTLLQTFLASLFGLFVVRLSPLASASAANLSDCDLWPEPEWTGYSTMHSYDVNGNLLSRTSGAKSVITVYEYDSSNQLTAIHYDSGAE